MRITGSSARQQALDWSTGIRDLLGQRGDHVALKSVSAAIAQFEAERIVIAVLGKAKRGKSTLLNAMLGRHDDLVAPIDKLPASSAITRIGWGAQEATRVIFRDGRQEAIGYERIREYVTEESNPENRKGVDVVEVSGPFTGLDKDLILVDTPGAGSLHEHHDAILQAFIPQSDAVLFLVTARMPLDQDELELLKSVKAADIPKVFFAINRIDESNEQDIEAAIAHNRKLLGNIGISVDHIYRISAKNALTGHADSGVPELFSNISRFVAANKGRILSDRLISRVCQCAEPAAQSLTIELTSSQKSEKELNDDLHKLQNSKHSIDQDRSLTEREFTSSWKQGIDRFERSVKEAKSNVKTTILSHISRTHLTGVGKLAKELPSVISHTVEESLAASAQRLEEALSDAAHKLQASYPMIEVKSAGEVTVRTRAGHHVVFGGLGGAAAVAAGVGLAAAGSAAAAGIAAANALALAAATTTVAAPTALASVGTLASILSSVFGYSWIGTIGSALTAGTATTTAAAPVALATTPFWVAIAGPVGWTLAGVGVLALPIAWRMSRVKQKEQLEEASRQLLDEIFQRILVDRIAALHRMGTSILEDFKIRLDRQLMQIESTISKSIATRPDASRITELRQLNQAFQEALAAVPKVEA